MTATNTHAARRTATFALAFSALPNLDELPALAHIDVRASHISGDDAEVEAQLASTARATAREDTRDVLAWRDALAARFDVAPYGSHAPNKVHLSARGLLGGVDVEIWSAVTLDPDAFVSVQIAAEADRAAVLLKALDMDPTLA
jgi:hypothetical protein